MLLLFLQGCIGWFPPVVWERLACRLLFWTPFFNDFRAGCHCGRWSAFLLSKDVSPYWPCRNTGSWADSWAAGIGIGSLARVEWGKKLQVIFCLVCFFFHIFCMLTQGFRQKVSVCALATIPIARADAAASSNAILWGIPASLEGPHWSPICATTALKR